jgi:Domain of unknown function DUF11
MRNTLLALSLVLVPTVVAQTADMRITQAILSTTPLRTGERIALSTRWMNEGPSPARFVNVTVTGTPSPYFVLSNATTGWPCYPNASGDTFRCQNPELASGDEAGLVVQMITPATPGPFTLRIEVTAEQADPDRTNNVVTIPMEIVAAPSTDLSLSPSEQLHRAENGAEVSLPFIVTNSGTNAVTGVVAVFVVPVTDNIPEVIASGPGWSCGHPSYGEQAVLCTRPALEGGVTAPITLTTNAPDDGTLVISGRVGGEGYSDPLVSNNSATATITSEPEVEPGPVWKRVMFPLIGADVHGANGSIWRTEVTGMVASDTSFEYHPNGCEPPVLCAPPPLPLRQAFDVFGEGIAGGYISGLGQFIYFREADEPKVHFNARVYDVSRSAETAGSEIPIVREKDFTSEPLSLLGIPVASHYRHTLRVYDVDGSDGPVTIRIYANDETTPRLITTRNLIPSNQAWQAGHPVFPGTTQFEIGQVMSLAGIETLRVDIEAAEEGLRLWSFVSVTNNDTHHVTTFSAQ